LREDVGASGGEFSGELAREPTREWDLDWCGEAFLELISAGFTNFVRSESTFLEKKVCSSRLSFLRDALEAWDWARVSFVV